MILAVQRAQPDDQYGDVFVDTDKSMEVYREWRGSTGGGICADRSG